MLSWFNQLLPWSHDFVLMDWFGIDIGDIPLKSCSQIFFKKVGYKLRTAFYMDDAHGENLCSTQLIVRSLTMNISFDAIMAEVSDWTQIA